jgi:kynurenine/2-aminoadipate aminotransferase
VPTGGNPTGASLSLDRRRALYAVARRHDLLLIEDDPYYYLSYTPARTPSLLSMDTDGRVLRTDSFSKVLSAGLRVGVLTGPPPLVDRINLHNQASIMHPSGLSQLAVLLLLRHWRVGESGSGGGGGGGAVHGPPTPRSTGSAAFEGHLARIRAFYSSQCDALLSAADTHLVDAAGAPTATYTRPSAGMFLWLRLLAGVRDSGALITKEAVAAKVLMVPGAAFYAAGAPPTPFVRAAFSTASHEEMDAAMQRLGRLLRERPREG